MDKLIGKVSAKGQVVIPVAIRKELGIKNGTKVSFVINKYHEIVLKTVPTALDWSNLLRTLPHEDVKINKDGHYDPKQAPNFHDWMVNG